MEYRIAANARAPLIAANFPYALMSANAPKEHQTKGFDWLVEAWTKGWPGVLLADDMGLGKTYQALAFSPGFAPISRRTDGDIRPHRPLARCWWSRLRRYCAIGSRSYGFI